MRDQVFQAARAAASERGRVFRIPFWPLFALTGGCAVVLTTLLWFVLWMRSPMPPPLPDSFLFFLPCLLCILAVEFLFSLVLQHGFRVEVTESGVTASDLWGVRRTMTWAEMENVTPVYLMGSHYLKIASFRQSRWALYVPQPLTEPEAFLNAVLHRASPLNPLRRSLENGGSAAEREKLAL